MWLCCNFVCTLYAVYYVRTWVRVCTHRAERQLHLADNNQSLTVCTSSVCCVERITQLKGVNGATCAGSKSGLCNDRIFDGTFVCAVQPLNKLENAPATLWRKGVGWCWSIKCCIPLKAKNDERWHNALLCNYWLLSVILMHSGLAGTHPTLRAAERWRTVVYGGWELRKSWLLAWWDRERHSRCGYSNTQRDT